MNKRRKSKQKLGDIGIKLRSKLLSPSPPVDDPTARKRLFAEFIRVVEPQDKTDGKSLQATVGAKRPLPNLSPRMRQTLDRLLVGDSEKQIARHLGVSKHTVHVYVKALYRGFEVCSRGELLAKFVHRPESH